MMDDYFCEHSEVKKTLRLLGGRITFGYCTECGVRVEYKGKDYKIAEWQTQLNYYCITCKKDILITEEEFDPILKVSCSPNHEIILLKQEWRHKGKVVERTIYSNKASS